MKILFKNNLISNSIEFIKTLTREYFIHSFFLTLPQAIAILVGLVTLPIILANLPAKNYGEFQFTLALQTWLVALTGGHITLGAKRSIAKGLDGTFLFAFFSRFKFLVAIGLMGFIASFFIYNVGLVNLSFLLTVISAFLIFGYLFQVSYPEFFIAKKQFRNFAIWKTITSLLTSVASALVAFFTHSILLFAITSLGSVTLISWTGFLYVTIKNRLFSAYKENKIDKECFSYGVRLIPAALILQTSSKIAHFIIGPFLGFTNLATFSVASKLEGNFRGFMKSFYNLFYADFAKVNSEKLIMSIRSKLKQGGIVAIILTLGCMFLGYFYIKLFLPEFYQITILYFLVLCLGLPAIILQVILDTILAVNFRYKELTAIAILANLIKIALILRLGVTFKIMGVCWGIVIGGWISFILYYLLTLRREKLTGFLDNHPTIKALIKRY